MLVFDILQLVLGMQDAMFMFIAAQLFADGIEGMQLAALIQADAALLLAICIEELGIEEQFGIGEQLAGIVGQLDCVLHAGV